MGGPILLGKRIFRSASAIRPIAYITKPIGPCMYAVYLQLCVCSFVSTALYLQRIFTHQTHQLIYIGHQLAFLRSHRLEFQSLCSRDSRCAGAVYQSHRIAICTALHNTMTSHKKREDVIKNEQAPKKENPIYDWKRIKERNNQSSWKRRTTTEEDPRHRWKKAKGLILHVL